MKLYNLTIIYNLLSKKGSVLLLLVCSATSLFAGHPSDSLQITSDSSFVIAPLRGLSFGESLAADVFEEGLVASSFAAGDSIQFFINQARAVMDKLEATKNYITHLDEMAEVELPVGLSRTIGGLTYTIGIQAIRLKPNYAELDVYMVFTVPDTKKDLTFMARGIKLTSKGGIVGDARLELVGDHAMNFLGNKASLIFKGSTRVGAGGGTFVTMDCEGFKEMGISADIEFSRDLIRPEKLDGTPDQGRVRAAFTTQVSNWNDLIVQLSLPTFEVPSLPGVGFAVKNAVFDFSDVRNAPAVNFPAGYESTQMLPDNPNLWRGFYMQELTVMLPPQFKTTDSTARASFHASDVIIDNMGFTGKLTGAKIIGLDKGNMNHWAFSVDSLDIHLQANELVKAGFNGQLVVPVTDINSPFNYKAVINTGGNYLFNVSNTSAVNFSIWNAADVTLSESSSLEVQVVNGKFMPKANLHGRMTVSGKLSEGGQGLSLADIRFENLTIQSVKPYIQVGTFSFGSELSKQKMAGFPISIKNVGMRTIADNEVGLDFELLLNLVGEGAGSFAADAGLTVVGKMDTERGWQSWRYKTTQVNDISVDIDGGAFKINGKLSFYRNDVAYGDGFNGSVKAEFKPGIKVDASAIFGSVNGMRYWYTDGMVNFPGGVPIFSGVGIYGFGGGAYYHMKMDNQGIGSDLGRTSSGIVYVPDENAGLGLKAIVNMASHPKEQAFNADVTFEIAFFKGGGVRYISFAGNGYLVTAPVKFNLDKLKAASNKMVTAVKKLEDKMGSLSHDLLESGSATNSMDEIFGGIGEKAGEKGSISAHVLISYDFENRVLHGNFDMYINVAGGLIKGIGPEGRAGTAVLHFAPGEWYIYVGTPEDRIGVGLGVGSIRAKADSYFMVGSKILGSPPPPPEVTKILGGGDYNYMKDLNAIGDGAGFAFGSSLSFSTGDLTFLMFYARFAAGAGFDIMLKDYGNVRCEGSSRLLGINGWYANGQAYGYFDGAIGISVKVFGKHRSVEILTLAAAALLQAQLPNPIWMQGTVGGSFSVLGGLVHGDCKFQLTLGEKCKIVKPEKSILEDVPIIAQITPTNGEKDVSVFNSPQVVFNMPVDKEFELLDEGVKKVFRIKLDYFKVANKASTIAGTSTWNEAHDVVAYKPVDIFPSKIPVKITAQVSFEELKNGSWNAVVVDGNKVVQSAEVTFTSGDAPDHIVLENVAYSYPVIDQTNFYVNEATTGYIKLKQGQPDLFNLGAEWKQVGRLTPASGTPYEFTFTHSNGLVSFEIPSQLKTNDVYAFELLNVPKTKGLKVDRNVSSQSSKVTLDGQKLDTEITTKKAEGNIAELQEKAIFTSHFHASPYKKFGEKIARLNLGKGWTYPLLAGVNELGTTLQADEMFDAAELGNSTYDEHRLVMFMADLSKTDWYTEYVQPLVYEGYPLDGTLSITNRKPIDLLGVPPAKAIYIDQAPSAIKFNANEAITSYAPPTIEHTWILYNLPLEMYRDYLNLQAQAAALSTTSKSDRLTKLLTDSFPVVRTGKYYFMVQYVLPGIRKVSSEHPLSIEYPVPNIQ